MKSVLSLLLVFGAYSASAAQVTFKCSPKAFACNPQGTCSWYEMYEGVTTTIILDQDNLDQNIYRARYQTALDGHQLTLDFRFNQDNPDHPLRVNAYLGATNVMAESSGTNNIDIALRNNSYGRGFVCSHIHAN